LSFVAAVFCNVLIAQVVVVTGSSQGMGKSVAILLAQRGAHVAIIARNQSRLDSALAEIRSAARDHNTQKFFSYSADLTRGPATMAAFDAIQKELGTPDIVWQCAGGTKPGYFRDYSSEELENEVAMNYFTALHTAHAAVRMMTNAPTTTPEKRHIILTSSVVAFYPLAGYNAYSPAKAAIRSLADGLRQECLLYDIDVHACFPATIYTPGFEEEQKSKPELTKILEGADEGQTPEAVAVACLKGLERGDKLVTTTLMGSAMRGSAWGGSPKGVWDTLFAMLLCIVWSVVGRVMDWDVVKYRKRLVKEGRTV
jgi:3-dehydrosphinganine reductase